MRLERLRAPSARHAVGAAAALLLGLSATAQAQYLGGGTKSAAEVQIADLQAMSDKFIALAEAFPEELYDWRPMEGVRSVRDVFALIIAEGNLFPTMWDFPRPDWAADGGIGPELARVQALTKADVVAELRRSLDHVIEISQGLSDEERARQVVFFGLTTDLSTALTLMQSDMHEHLGQSIAYARMNQIVPPWSR